MRPPPLPVARLRAALAAHGAAPRRRHGQHFLLDDNLLAAIVRDAGVGPGETVLEVGPGPGLLTRHLLGSGAEVIAVEIDARLGAVAGDLVEPALRARLHWIEADVLDGLHALAAPVREALPRCSALVSNLPYNVAAPLLILLAGEADAPTRQVVMVQRELAERLLAGPGSRAYGGPSVLIGLAAEGRILRAVPPQAFWPRPRVDSVVLALALREGRPCGARVEELRAFVAAAFHNRRKTLLNSLAEASGHPPGRIAEALGLPENRQKLRAEALQALDFSDLAHTWAVSALGERHRP